MEDEPKDRSEHFPALDARLPVVVCNPELTALKDVGLKLKCNLFDVLFAVFGLTVREVGAASFRPRAIWSGDTRATDAAGNGKIGYVISLPRKVWCAGSPRDAISCLDSPGSDDGAVAFIHRGEARPRGAIHAPSDRRRHASQSLYGTFDLVAEVTESEHHVLIECFFRSEIVDRNSLARLLFRYLEGVKEAGRAPLHG
jgi:hypothetical protein